MSRLTVIPERISSATPTEPTRYIYHLPKGRWDDEASWQEIHCGAGIAFPWRETVERFDACPACLKAAKR